jgi:hypothetical protein
MPVGAEGPFGEGVDAEDYSHDHKGAEKPVAENPADKIIGVVAKFPKESRLGARLGAPPRAGQPSGCDPEGLAELTTGIGSDSPRIAGSRGEREVKSGAGERRAGDDSRAMLHRATEISAGNSALRESDSHAQRGAYARPVNLATDPSVRFASMVGFLLAKQL